MRYAPIFGNLQIFAWKSCCKGILTNLPKQIVHKSRNKNNCFGIGKLFSNTSAIL